MNELDKALDNVTFELLEGLKQGDMVTLSENYEIYHYENDDHIVIYDNDEQEEIFCVLYNRKNKQIIFQEL